MAAETARTHGTTLVGNIRWYGASGPKYREVLTKDGRTIRIIEPRGECLQSDRRRCPICGEYYFSSDIHDDECLCELPYDELFPSEQDLQ